MVGWPWRLHVVSREWFNDESKNRSITRQPPPNFLEFTLILITTSSSLTNPTRRPTMPCHRIGWLLSLILCTTIWADDRSPIAPNDDNAVASDNYIPSFKKILTEIFPEPGWIVVEATYGDDRPAPKGSSLEVQILDIDSAKVVTNQGYSKSRDRSTRNRKIRKENGFKSLS